MRLFIGIPLPKNLQDAIQTAWRQTNFPFKNRPIRPNTWHVTLAFLDDVPEDKLEPLKQLVEKAVNRPPDGNFLIEAFETFPPRRQNRVVLRLMPEKDKEWKAFVHDLREMASIVAPDIDRKPWTPHVSITKSEKGLRLPTWRQKIEPVVSWKPDHLAIIKSVMESGGAIHTNLHVFPFNI